MKHYELLFILKPTLTEEEVSAKVDFIKEILTKNGANIASVQTMGTRKLAYTVKKIRARNLFRRVFRGSDSSYRRSRAYHQDHRRDHQILNG